jgi:hypothetical protein
VEYYEDTFSVLIFITQDLNIMALSFGGFALPPKKWVKFQGGFAFTIEEDQTLLLDYSELKPVVIPHWWKKS